MLFVVFLVMVMKVDWLSVLYRTVFTTTAPVLAQSLLVAVRSILMQVNMYVTMYVYVSVFRWSKFW